VHKTTLSLCSSRL